jgi:hypothetical protein
MYPQLDLRQLMAMYAPRQMQFAPQQQDQRMQQQQGGGGGSGPLNPSNLKQWQELFQGGGGTGGMAAGGEAAPIGLVGDYSGAMGASAAPMAMEGAGLAGGAAGGAAGGMGAAGAAEGLGAGGAALGEGMAGLGAGMGEGLAALFALFSDPRVKENKAPVGKLYDGTPVWSYNYIGDPTPRIGLMANEVRPDAVFDVGGVKAVNYGRATENARAIGGILGDLGA